MRTFEYKLTGYDKPSVCKLCNKHGGYEPPNGCLPALYEAYGNWYPFYVPISAVPYSCKEEFNMLKSSNNY